jgi:cytochrome c oxidase cbb3-type subunit 3
MNNVVSLLVDLVVLGTIAGCLWLMWWTNRGGPVSPTETTHVWDEDLTEYNHPLPRWWLWMFVSSIIFALVYLAIYPGLGNFSGLKHWSAVSQWQHDDAAARAAMAKRFAAYEGQSLTALEHDPSAMATARNLFGLNCAPCHGSDARGAKGFPNLTDADWLWGGS